MRNTYKRRPQDFKRRVLVKVFTNRIDLLNEEQRWLYMMKDSELKIRYYNLTRNVKNTQAWWVKEDGTYLSVKEKMSRKVRKHNEEHPEKGKMHSERMKKYCEEHPEEMPRKSKMFWGKPGAREEMRQLKLRYCEEHPEFREEMRQLKLRYCEEHPEFREDQSKRTRGFFEEHPEARIAASEKTKIRFESSEARKVHGDIMRDYYSKNRKPQKKLQCPHCGILGRNSNMKRYHFDNCKLVHA